MGNGISKEINVVLRLRSTARLNGKTLELGMQIWKVFDGFSYGIGPRPGWRVSGALIPHLPVATIATSSRRRLLGIRLFLLRLRLLLLGGILEFWAILHRLDR